MIIIKLDFCLLYQSVLPALELLQGLLQDPIDLRKLFSDVLLDYSGRFCGIVHIWLNICFSINYRVYLYIVNHL